MNKNIQYDAWLLWNVSDRRAMHCDYCFNNLGKKYWAAISVTSIYLKKRGLYSCC